MHIFLLTMITLGLGVVGATPVQAIAEILARLQSNARDAYATRVSLECKERRTAQSSYNGATTVVWRVETNIVRNQDGRPFRKLLSVEGNVPQTWLEGDTPFGNEELFGTAENIFSFPNRYGREFKAAGSESLNGRPTLLVEFEGRPPNFTREFGKAWIDRDSFQVIRIELHSLNGIYDPFTTEEYASTRIDGKDFWLPAKRTIETKSLSTGGLKMIETTELRECRRFQVSTTVRPAQ
jgi:hypothetical protein